MRKLYILLMIAFVALGISGCSNSGNKESAPTVAQALTPEGSTPTVAEISAPEGSTPVAAKTLSPEGSTPAVAGALAPKVTAKIDYTVLEEFKVFQQDKGYGACILIDKNAKKEDIIDLLKKIGENKDPVAIEVFTSKQAYEEYKKIEATDEFKKGYIASYTKNKTLSKEAFYGENSITWTQEIGNFSSLLFTTTNLDGN